MILNGAKTILTLTYLLQSLLILFWALLSFTPKAKIVQKLTEPKIIHKFGFIIHKYNRLEYAMLSKSIVWNTLNCKICVKCTSILYILWVFPEWQLVSYKIFILFWIEQLRLGILERKEKHTPAETCGLICTVVNEKDIYFVIKRGTLDTVA